MRRGEAGLRFVSWRIKYPNRYESRTVRDHRAGRQRWHGQRLSRCGPILASSRFSMNLAVSGKIAVVNTGRELGRIVVPPDVPAGFRLFYTTIDFDGRIDDRIREFVKPAALFSCHQVHSDRVAAAFRPPD